MIKMYDELEETSTRFVGVVGDERWDLAITRTNHFYGKSLVTLLTNNRTGIIGHDDLEEDKLHILAQTFNLKSEEETAELAEFLRGNL